MEKVFFEWDEGKDRENREKHNVSFSIAQRAFLDPRRVIVEDVSHSTEEDRFYCIGKVGDGIHHCSIHLSGEHHPYLWCGVLEKREEDL